MIHPVQQITVNGVRWFYQEFSPDALCDDSGFNLYNSAGDFVAEFDALNAMLSWIIQSAE